MYKLSAVEENGKMEPRIKISETVAKITNPGLKDVYRIFNEEGHAVADLLVNAGEEVDLSKPYRFVDPESPWKKRTFVNCTARKLQVPVIRKGERVMSVVPTTEIAAYVKRQLREEIWKEEQRFENPHKHYLDMSVDYYNMKMRMLEESR